MIRVSLPAGLRARVPVNRVNDLLIPYCEGFGRALPDDPGPGPDVVEVEIPSELLFVMKNQHPEVSTEEIVRRVLVANATPEQKAKHPKPALVPHPEKSPSPVFSVLFAMLVPVVALVLTMILLRRFPPSRVGGSFDEWAGGQ
jgi:hypothetical protein